MQTDSCQPYAFKQVDVFTQTPFGGNPVAVVLAAEGLTTEAMQQIAAWTNLSETTFVLPPTSTQADYRLRIFTPKQELPFAGHPTIGSAHAVLESGFAAAQNGQLRQECLAGIIPLSVQKTALGQQILAEAPPAKVMPLVPDALQLLTQALGVPLVSATPPLRVDVGPVWLIADLGDADTVADLSPDMAGLTTLSQITQATGVTVFGRANDGISKLHVRSFAPAQGIPEDPVCGSGNVCVAAFLMHSNLVEPTGMEYIARQGMQMGRDGQINIRIAEGKIEFGGYSVTCIEGRLRTA
jgi:PhzF family phenazine biosynthesis protein